MRKVLGRYFFGWGIAAWGIIFLILCLFPKNISFKIHNNEEGDKQIVSVYLDNDEVDDKNGDYVFDYKNLLGSNLVIETYSDDLSISICDYRVPIYNLESKEFVQYVNTEVSYPDNSYLENLTLDDVFSIYNNPDYMMIMAVNGDGGYKMSCDSIDAIYNILGAEKTPADYEFGSSYLLISVDGHAEYLNAGNGTSVYNGNILGVDIRASSDGYLSDKESGCSIEINDVEYAPDTRGVNIVVYDLKNACVIDSIAFDTVDDGEMYRDYSVFNSLYTYTFSDNFVTGMKSYVCVITIIIKAFLIVLFVITSLIIWMICDLIYRDYDRKLIISRWVIVQILITIFMMISVCIPYGFKYLKEGYEDVSLSQLIYHMNTNLDGTNWTDFNNLFGELLIRIIYVIVVNICLFALFMIYKRINIRISIIGMKTTRVISIAISIYLVVSTMLQFDETYGVINYVVTQNTSSNIYEEYYVDPETAEITFPSTKKNLIYIYMESIENTYADKR